MYLLFDIGGTNTRIGISKTGSKIDKAVMIHTPRLFAVAMDEYRAVAADLASGAKIKAAAAGIFGPLDKSGSKLVSSKLPDWLNKPLKRSLAQIAKAPVSLHNDASLGALGEAVFGAGKGKNIIGYYTVSTGVGGARIVSGQIDHGVYNLEPGWQIIDQRPVRTLHEKISGKNLQARHRVVPTDIKSKSAWREFEDDLSTALCNSILHWSPDIFILGGPIIMKGKFSLQSLNSSVRKKIAVFKKTPAIVKAKLGQLSGLYGALALAKSK